MRRLIVVTSVALGGRGAYRLLARGAATIDLGVGRRTRRLGPLRWRIRASREVVFDVIAEPYLGPTPRALQDKLQVWERGSDMVLAAHFTELKCGVTTTVETVSLYATRARRLPRRPGTGAPRDRVVCTC